MSRNLGTIFLPQAPKMYNNVDRNMIQALLSLWVIRWSLHIDKIHKNKNHSALLLICLNWKTIFTQLLEC